MDNNLGIRILAKLNQAESIKEINKGLEAIEKQIGNIGVSIDAKGTAQEIKKQMKSIGSQNIKPIELDADELKKDFSMLGKDIEAYKREFGATTSSVVKNIDLQEKALTSLMLTMKNADGMSRKVTFTPFQDTDENGKLVHTFKASLMTVSDNTEKINQKVQKDFKDMQFGINRSLLKIADDGKLTTEQLQHYFNKLNTSKTTAELSLLKQELNSMKSNASKGEFVTRNDSLKKLDSTTRNHVATILDANEAYKGMELRGIKVDQVTGQWSATLKKSSRENLELKGRIDQSTGSLYKQSEAIKQVNAANLGMLEQMKIALSRVPIWMASMTVNVECCQ